jgi:hypothetical protein
LRLRLSSDFAVDTDDYKREGLRFSILAMSGRRQTIDAALVGLVQKRILEWVEDKHANARVYSLTGDALERIKEGVTS